MSWTSPADLKAQVQRLWDRGLLLHSLISNEPSFPLRLVLKGPSSTDLTDRFEDVRNWIATVRTAPVRLVMRTVRHRVLGKNDIPREVWIDSASEALRLIGKARDAERFMAMVNQTRDRCPELMALFTTKPLQMLQFEARWPLLLDVVTWIRGHPRPGIYLRQIDVPGVHTKVVEAHLGMLIEMLDLVVPESTDDKRALGVAQFCVRFGFREKPLRVRFRTLDSALNLLPGTHDQDLTLDQRSFAELAVRPARIFVTENETNFLAFPPSTGGMVVFGGGYGFQHLLGVEWLRRCDVRYWGDIDTHGFAILDQLRSHFPDARSFLMDLDTLLEHRQLWGVEPRPETRRLNRLTADERAVFDTLRDQIPGQNLRLEQEHIRFGCLLRALLKIESSEVNASTSS